VARAPPPASSHEITLSTSFRARLNPVLYHSNRFRRCTPQNNLVVIVSLQAIGPESIQLAVIDSRSIRPGWQLNARSIWKVVSAPSDYHSPRWRLQGTLVHLIPHARVVVRGGVCDLYNDRHSHVSSRTDSYRSQSGCQQTVHRFLCPTFREIPFYTLVLQIELKVVGKKLELKSPIHSLRSDGGDPLRLVLRPARLRGDSLHVERSAILPRRPRSD
jgi:hypothetical protein